MKVGLMVELTAGQMAPLSVGTTVGMLARRWVVKKVAKTAEQTD